MFPFIFFPNNMLPKQLYYILNEGRGTLGVGTYVVLIQVFLLLYTSTRSIYSLVKRDNHTETFVVLMLPLCGLFLVCTMETILFGNFMGDPNYNPQYTLGVLQYPGMYGQVLCLAVLFMGAALLYEWMNHRLNKRGLPLLLLVAMYALESATVLASLFLGVQGMRGDLQWLSEVPAPLLKWYAYGLALLVAKTFVYLAAILLGLLFANQTARASLWHRRMHDMEPEQPVPDAEGFFGSEYHDFGAGRAEPDMLESERRLKRYIRTKAFPYFLGLGLFGFGGSGTIIALEYHQYVEGLFYHPGDLPFSIVFGVCIIGIICGFGWLENLIGVVCPGQSKAYRSVLVANANGLAIERFQHEFFEARPLVAVGSMNNVILTPGFLVIQGYRLKIIPLSTVAFVSRAVPIGSAPLAPPSMMVLHLKNGKQEKVAVSPSKDPMGRVYGYLMAHTGAPK